MTKILEQYCESALKVLTAQYETTKVLKHKTTADTAREQLIKDFLSDHLPDLVNVLSGQIFDSSDGYSRQQDVVLVLKSMPRLPFASENDLIYVEGVVATIEIKTSLNSTVLNGIGENIESVRNLTLAIPSSEQLTPTHNWPPTRILTTILTYGGITFDTITEGLESFDENSRPDLLLDFEHGLLIRNHGFLVNVVGADTYLRVPNATLGFMYFLTFLTEITGTLSARGVEWRKYV